MRIPPIIWVPVTVLFVVWLVGGHELVAEHWTTVLFWTVAAPALLVLGLFALILILYVYLRFTETPEQASSRKFKSALDKLLSARDRARRKT